MLKWFRHIVILSEKYLYVGKLLKPGEQPADYTDTEDEGGDEKKQPAAAAPAAAANATPAEKKTDWDHVVAVSFSPLSSPLFPHCPRLRSCQAIPLPATKCCVNKIYFDVLWTEIDAILLSLADYVHVFAKIQNSVMWLAFVCVCVKRLRVCADMIVFV